MTQQTKKQNIIEIVISATDNFTKILSVVDMKKHYSELYWGGNGIGDRWCNKYFNYSAIYSKKKPRLYGEYDDNVIPSNVLDEFLQNNTGSGIIGIYVHSIRKNNQPRQINKYIYKEIINYSCVVCGTNETICDHKNDLYNDIRVLNVETQFISDFQPLCNHCNLQKRQICNIEKQTKKLFSAKNIQRYKIYPFEFPWEKKSFDINNINCKTGTFWFDPVEFDKNIYYYSICTIPIINEIKLKIKMNNLKLIL